MVTMQRAGRSPFTFEKVLREPAFTHAQIKGSDPTGSESDEEMTEIFANRANKKTFIFEEAYHRLVSSRTTQEEQGNLFGLWTTDGEPVIHKVCPSICAMEHHSRTVDDHEDDIFSKRLPLTHIGNWRYNGVLSLKRCPHQFKPRAKFLDLTVSKTKLSVSEDDKRSQVVVISGRSPFANVTGFKTLAIKGHQEDVDADVARAMKHLLSSKATSGKRKELFISPNLQDPITTLSASQVSPMYLGAKGFQREFAPNLEDFKIFMFEEDYQMMQNLVLRYPHLETGGDLFGLWTTDGNAVLHVVLGPGQNCKRTGVSFYQDVPYLKENGELLTQDYMLCHIGEWHSHHQLHLFQPSGGDSSTVIRNYPRGVCGFLLIIANILSSHEVRLSPYLYTKSSSYSFDKAGRIVLLTGPNAFKRIHEIREKAERGKERYTYSQGGQFNGNSEYATDLKEFRRYPTQTVQINRMKRFPNDRRRHTLQYTSKPYELPKSKAMFSSSYQHYSVSVPRSRGLSARRSRPKRAKSSTGMNDRPPWKS